MHEHNKSWSAVEVASQGAEEAWTMKLLCFMKSQNALEIPSV